MNKDLHLFPRKTHLIQEPLLQDHLRRFTCAKRMLQLDHNNSDIHEIIIINDEAYFHLNVYVKKQNIRSVLGNGKTTNYSSVIITSIKSEIISLKTKTT